MDKKSKYYILNIKTYNSVFKLLKGIKEIDDDVARAKRLLLDKEIYKIAMFDDVPIYIDNTLKNGQIIGNKYE